MRKARYEQMFALHPIAAIHRFARWRLAARGRASARPGSRAVFNPRHECAATKPAAMPLYCADVRTLHPKLHVAANPRALSAHGAGGDPNFSAVQCLPDRSGGCCRSERRRARACGDALGPGAFWWSKPLKELRLATFNARVETVTTRPFFRRALQQRRCIMPVSATTSAGHPRRKQPNYFTARDGSLS